MNHLRDAIHAKMAADGISFASGSVRVVDTAFESGIYNSPGETFSDVTFVVEVCYAEPASGRQERAEVRIPVEGWSEAWDQVRQGIVAAANTEHLEASRVTGR